MKQRTTVARALVAALSLGACTIDSIEPEDQELQEQLVCPEEVGDICEAVDAFRIAAHGDAKQACGIEDVQGCLDAYDECFDQAYVDDRQCRTDNVDPLLAWYMSNCFDQYEYEPPENTPCGIVWNQYGDNLQTCHDAIEWDLQQCREELETCLAEHSCPGLN